MNVDVDATSAASLFTSCANTEASREMRFTDYEELFNFEGQFQAIGHGLDITFNYTVGVSPYLTLVLDNLDCRNFTLPGTNASQACTCATCLSACPAVGAAVE